MALKKLDYETKKKVRQYGKHARAMTKIVKTTRVASHDLFEAVKKGEQEEFLAAEEEARTQEERLRKEERERRKALRQSPEQLEQQRQIKEAVALEEEKRRYERGLSRVMESVAKSLKKPFTAEERMLLATLTLGEKEKYYRELAKSLNINFDEEIENYVASEGQAFQGNRGKEWKE